ncbi:hypothetical protein GCM10027200_01130 [Lentzea nigeriaca]
MRLGSTVSHFISFSGVTLLNSVVHVFTYADSPRWLWAMAAPKYRPLCAAAAPSVLAAAVAGDGASAVAAVSPAAVRTASADLLRRRRDGLLNIATLIS